MGGESSGVRPVNRRLVRGLQISSPFLKNTKSWFLVGASACLLLVVFPSPLRGANVCQAFSVSQLLARPRKLISWNTNSIHTSSQYHVPHLAELQHPRPIVPATPPNKIDPLLHSVKEEQTQHTHQVHHQSQPHHQSDVVVVRKKPARNRKEDIDLTRQVIIKHLESWIEEEKQPKVLRETLTNISSTAYNEFKEVVSSQKSTPPQKVDFVLRMPVVELSLGMLVLVNCIVVAFDTMPNLPLVAQRFVDVIYDVITYIFCAEFFARWYANSESESSWRYFTRPLVMVDAAVNFLPLLLSWLSPTARIRALIPRFLTTAEGLQNLRLLRILKLQRALIDRKAFSRNMRALGLKGYNDIRTYHLQLARVVLSVFTLLSVTSGLIYAAEFSVNPKINNYFSALYFGICTLTTVGFGDIAPISVTGKLVVCCSILAGVLVIPKQAADLVDALLKQERDRQRKEENRMFYRQLKLSKKYGLTGGEQPMKSCHECGAGAHTNAANYCWACGSELEDSDA